MVRSHALRRRNKGYRLELESLEDRCLLAVFTVTNLHDGPVSAAGDLPGSLRQAIYDANNNPGPDEIVWQPDLTGTIALTNGELRIMDDVTITALGDGQTTIDANQASRVFNIDDETGTLLSVQINAMHITGGSVMESGGGIRSAEFLTLVDATISGNSALATSYVSGGGGIYSLTDVTLTGSTISGNTVANNFYSETGGKGGGVLSLGDVALTDSTVSGNTAGSYIYDPVGGKGGGIYSIGLTVIGSTIADNAVIHPSGGFGYGGGLFGESVTVKNSTITGNSTGNGGGIMTFSGNLTLTGSTVSGNTASYAGGGIWSSGAIRNSTITENHASSGSGIAASYLQLIEISSSIISGNVSSYGGDVDHVFDGADGILSLGGNLVGNGNAVDGFDHPTDQTGVTDPQLGPLTNHGGPTSTHAVLPGSPAIDAGDPDAIAGTGNTPLFDQRGSPYIRVLGERIDIGAYELRPVSAVDGDFNNDGIYDCQDIDNLIVAIAAGSNDAEFDMTGDGLVSLADRDAWLAEAGTTNLGPGKSYLLGDANLDGVVDGLDFIAWNENKFSPLPVVFGWCDANFNGDGVVDGLDFIIWNENKFQSSDVPTHLLPPTLTLVTKKAEAARPALQTFDRPSSVAPQSLPLDADRADLTFAISRDNGQTQRDYDELLADSIPIFPCLFRSR